MTSSLIHRTAIIEPGAEIGEGTRIGPYAVIGPKVRLGRDCIVGPHAVVEGRTEIGDRNQIFQFASVGAPPQDLKWKGEETRLVIGHDNIIREYVTIQPGVGVSGGLTEIGDGNLFMACAHIAHDCRIGSHTRFANAATLAGHIEVGDHVHVSGLAGVHQFTRIGAHAFVAAGAMVAQDVPPFCLVQGDRARLVSLNEVGLRRHGFTEPEVLALRRVFRLLFRGTGTKAERMARVRRDHAGDKGVPELLEFLSDTRRGLVAA
ncbi:acyl-ACP--UDP-N-acetylglucosamine O-acyltransferase [Inquilinus limosus]|uniref:acyl-ACP--UDP-N-acetylglucosamine O-acyltransferase n=1 Tax=Inquilinus limosus TaxID=171674 RepID=UPI000420AD44|nr:acyl-ACP--UDP-N-acetylglucosamine O-acyltransferase [Inquilinus limosus]